MNIFEKELIKAINSGKAIIIIGAGPSCESGLPDWYKLAKIIVDENIDLIKTNNLQIEINKLFEEKNYPKIFSKLAVLLTREKLLQRIKQIIFSGNKPGKIYRFLSSFPFKFYLTTNYDCLLEKAFSEQDLSVDVKSNNLEDFYQLHNSNDNIIFKIHGDFSDLNSIVLTEEDYRNFQSSEEKEYWREKIFSVINQNDVLIIGYSVSDPDFSDQLARAKKICSPTHPVYMIGTGLKQQDIEKLFTEYNIRVISYQNDDGTHKELINILQRYSPFIAKKNSLNINIRQINPDEAEIASKIFLFTKFRIQDTSDNFLERTYSSIILKISSQQNKLEWIKKEIVNEQFKKELNITRIYNIACYDKSITNLIETHILEESPDFKSVRLSGVGWNLINEKNALINEDIRKFDVFCNNFLTKNNPNISIDNKTKVIITVKSSLLEIFKTRGLEIYKLVFEDDNLNLSDSSDILDIINNISLTLNEHSERLAFSELFLEIVTNPNRDIKKYLGNLCQGYFAYNVLGLENNSLQKVYSIVKQKTWIVDSNVLINALAIESKNWQYAKDLLELANKAQIELVTTEKLIEEVSAHLQWAFENFFHLDQLDPKFIYVAQGIVGYRINVFIQGFMSWKLSQGNPTLSNYFTSCFDSKFTTDFSKAIRNKIESLGIKIISTKSIDSDFNPSNKDQKNMFFADIQKIRKENDTFRSSIQCEAEAEVAIICNSGDYQFLSLSWILNRVINKKIVWNPEAFYYFLSLFIPDQIGDSSYYDCMNDNCFNYGSPIISTDEFKRTISGNIKQSRLDVNSELQELAIGLEDHPKILNEYDSIDDFQKPFYPAQLAFRIAREKSKEASQARKDLERVQLQKELSSGQVKDYIRLKKKQEERFAKNKRKFRRNKSKKK